MRVTRRLLPVLLVAALSLILIAGAARADEGPVIRLVYFYALDCSHCITVIEDVLAPLQVEYGERLQVKMVEISDAANYEMLIRAEEAFEVAPEARGLPTLILDGQVLVGEAEISGRLTCLLESCLGVGTAWPEVPGLDAVPVEGASANPGPGLEIGPGEIEPCDTTEVIACEQPTPIFVAYFYEVGCRECGRAEADLKHIQTRYAQLVVEEFNIYENVDLARWLAERAGRPTDVDTPAVFVGDDALIGTAEITPQNLEALAAKYAATGATATWETFDPAGTGPVGWVGRVGPLSISVAGLLDGLNPCAFATLIFFVSYLTVSGRQGRTVLAVGAAFTLGVFIAYLAIGLGLYKVLDLVRHEHAAVSRWVTLFTGVLCAVLAALSFLDYLKARRGQITDMALVMPEALHRRARAVIRESSGSGAPVIVALFTGAAVSLLELACTGQVYLATLVSMVSVPNLRGQAVPLLLLYNLAFVVPLMVVFVLVYFGTSSLRLGLFLRRRAAAVKLGTALLFAAFGAWLIVPVLI